LESQFPWKQNPISNLIIIASSISNEMTRIMLWVGGGHIAPVHRNPEIDIPIRPRALSLLDRPRESLQLSDDEAHLHGYCNYELNEISYLPPNF
jgi:hypothetical protein